MVVRNGNYYANEQIHLFVKYKCYHRDSLGRSLKMLKIRRSAYRDIMIRKMIDRDEQKIEK